MRFLRYMALLGILLVPAAYSRAQVSFGFSVGGPAYGYASYGDPYYAPPVCQWGYYSYYPYACAPYGYYGPAWFYNGIFLGAGPWYGRGWGWYRSGYGWGGWRRYPVGWRGGWYGGGWRGGYRGGYGGGYHGGYAGGGYHGGYASGGYHGGYGGAAHSNYSGGGFHGGSSGGFHGGGGGGFHGGGGGGFHGGGGGHR